MQRLLFDFLFFSLGGTVGVAAMCILQAGRQSDRKMMELKGEKKVIASKVSPKPSICSPPVKITSQATINIDVKNVSNIILDKLPIIKEIAPIISPTSGKYTIDL